jgi:hypothetical protein
MRANALLLGLSLLAGGVAAEAGPASDRAEAGEWAVRLEPSAGHGTAAFHLHLTSRAGYHVNLEYPMSFRTSPDSTVALGEARLALHPASSTPCDDHPKETCEVTVALPLTAPGTGEGHLSGTFAFSVCSAERCLIEKVKLLAAISPSTPPETKERRLGT